MIKIFVGAVEHCKPGEMKRGIAQLIHLVNFILDQVFFLESDGEIGPDKEAGKQDDAH